MQMRTTEVSSPKGTKRDTYKSPHKRGACIIMVLVVRLLVSWGPGSYYVRNGKMDKVLMAFTNLWQAAVEKQSLGKSDRAP